MRNYISKIEDRKEKFITDGNDKKKELIIALFINLAFLLYAILLRTPYNETNDDTGMAALASGAYGGETQYLVFINIIYGYFLKIFYFFIPNINWYSTFELLFSFLAFTIIGFVLLKKLGVKLGCLTYIFLLALFYNEFYLVLQFTRVSMLCCISGFILFYYSIEEAQSLMLKIIGALFVILGYLIRFGSFKCVILFAFFLGIFSIFETNALQSVLKGDFSGIKKYILNFGVLFLIIGVCIGIDYYTYNSDPEWKQYKEYTQLRAELADYGWPDYYENQKEFEKIGISENDYNLYKTANMADANVLSIETMQKIVDMKPDRMFSVSNFLYNLKEYVFKYNYLICILGIGVIGIIIGKNWMEKFMPIFIAILFFGVLAYYDYLERVVPRVLFPTILVAMVCQIYCFDSRRIKNIAVNTTQMMVFSIVIVCVCAGNYRISHKAATENRLDATVLYSILDNKEKKYVMDHRVYGKNYRFFDAFYHVEKDWYKNQINFGGWLSRTPTLNSINENLGITDIKEFMIEDNEAFFVTSDNEALVKEYIIEHTKYQDISYSIYDDGGICKIIKYSNNDMNLSDNVADNLIYDRIEESYQFPGYVEIYLQVHNWEEEKIKEKSEKYIQVIDDENGLDKIYRIYQDTLVETSNNSYEMKVLISGEDFRELDLEKSQFKLFY